METVLFIRPGGIGDAVLLIPAINALKKKYPNAAIDVLAEKRNGGIFALCPAVDRIFYYDKPNELLTAIRGRYDVIIDTEQWHRLSAIVARLARAPISIGYATNERKKLFTHAVPYSHDDYEVLSFFNLLTPFTGPLLVNLEESFLEVPPSVTDRVNPLLQPLANRPVVALFPGSSIPERRWGSDRFRQTARALIEIGLSVVVVGGRADRQAGDEISAGLHQIINLCGRLSLVETSAILRLTSLIIAGDSGILHIGYGLGKKSVALFGPGIEKKWAPKGNNCVIINKHLDCSPCTEYGYTPSCKKGAECMNLITVEEVYARAIELLER